MPETDDVQLVVHIPRGEKTDQDAEWCLVETEEGPRRIRFHDYHEIYAIPGLYERLFYHELQCDSPRTVRRLLKRVLAEQQADPAELVVLDLGAGNGMVGEELDTIGAGTIVGVDIIPEAAEATARDRPGIYDSYLVADLTEPSEELEGVPFNCLTSVAALGFGDIPPAAFARAYNAVADGGLVVFTIKESFLDDGDSSGFSALIRSMLEEKVMEPLVEHRYRHRLAVSGTPLHYLAFVAEKHSDVSERWLDAA